MAGRTFEIFFSSTFEGAARIQSDFHDSVNWRFLSLFFLMRDNNLRILLQTGYVLNKVNRYWRHWSRLKQAFVQFGTHLVRVYSIRFTFQSLVSIGNCAVDTQFSTSVDRGVWLHAYATSDNTTVLHVLALNGHLWVLWLERVRFLPHLNTQHKWRLGHRTAYEQIFCKDAFWLRRFLVASRTNVNRNSNGDTHMGY